MKKPIKAKLRKGDEVEILIGKSRGQTGKVERIDRKNHRVWVENQNIYKRHTKPNAQGGEDGGILDKVMPLHISNVAIVDQKAKKPVRIGFKTEDGDRKRKTRIARKTGNSLD